MGSTAAVADLIAMTIRAALAPVLAQNAMLTERCAALDARLAGVEPAVTLLRERTAVMETRAYIPGPPGKDGAAGSDGFSCDEMTAVQDPTDARLVTLAFRRGEQVKTIGTLRLNTPQYCGTYEDGKAYTPGDQVTHRGSQWHCNAATSARPGDGAAGWTLQVKCGRDGKDAGR
jgi:Carbohydrate binding domain.